MKSAVFLDRDGTIIVDKNYLNNPEDVEFLPLAIEGLKEMSRKGYLLIVVTNQSGVAKGLVQENNIHLIHKKMDTLLAPFKIKINAYYYNTSPATSNDPHRKPNPGMLLKAIEDFEINPQTSWMIGDRASDIEAGVNANTRTIYLKNPTHPLPATVTPNHTTKNLLEASQLLDPALSE